MLEEIEALIEKHFEDSDGALPSLECQEDEVDQFMIYEKDLTIDYLEVTSVTLVKGNLNVDFIEQFSSHSLLIVLGDLIVKRGFSISQICVLGDLRLQDDFVFDSMSEHDLFVGGSYSGGRLWLFDHEVRIEGQSEGEIIEESKRLLAECFEDGMPSAEIICERLKNGKSIQK